MSLTKKINVLHLRSCRGSGGGPEKTILFSIKEVDSARFEMSVAYLKSRHDPGFDLDNRAKALGIEAFVTIDEDYKCDIAAMKKLLKLLRDKRIDILHCHCYKSDLYGFILSRYHPMKLVTTAHGPLASLRYFWASRNWRVRYVYDQIDLRILKHFDAVLMVSESMRETISKYHVPADKLVWVKNAIDAAHFCADRQRGISFRNRLGIPLDAPVIGAVGRLNGEKDYPNFLAAAKLLLERYDNLVFTIAGTGSLEDSLRLQTRRLGISDKVHFLGHQPDVRPVYDMLDVYVLSSTREGLPNTVLEAMAMEVPIVSTDVDGVAEAVCGGTEAILVPARNARLLADGVSRVLDDPQLASHLCRTARDKVCNSFSFASRMRQVESIYSRVMADESVANTRAVRIAQ